MKTTVLFFELCCDLAHIGVSALHSGSSAISNSRMQGGLESAYLSEFDKHWQQLLLLAVSDLFLQYMSTVKGQCILRILEDTKV